MNESEKPYLAAIVDFLDRGPQTVKRNMCYPITRVELLSPVTLENPDGLPKRIFVVQEDGARPPCWVEVQ